MGTLKDRLRAAMAGPPKVKQVELARGAKVSGASVNDWLSGKTQSMKGTTLLQVARFLNVDPQWLATGRGAMRPRSGEGIVNEPEHGSGQASQIQRPEPAILAKADEWVGVLEAAMGAEMETEERMENLADFYLMLARNNGTLSSRDMSEIQRRVHVLAEKRLRGENEQPRQADKAGADAGKRYST